MADLYDQPPDTPLLPVLGDTYPHREQLRAWGGTWLPRERSWLVPREHWREAVALVGPQVPQGQRRRPRPAPPRRTAADPPPPGWRPCGYPGCQHWYCDDCDGRGAGGPWRGGR